MVAADQRRFLGAVLTSYAKQGDLVRALKLIRQLKEDQLASSRQHTPAQQPGASSSDVAQPSAANGHHRQDGAADEPLRHDGRADGAQMPGQQWCAEDGMRHLLLYTDVQQLYTCVTAVYAQAHEAERAEQFASTTFCRSKWAPAHDAGQR